MTPSPNWSRTEFLVLAGILAIGALLRIGCAVVLPSPLESDYLGYWTIANNLHDGQGLAGGDGAPTAFLSVGYPLFLAGVFAVLGPSIAAVKAANIGLGVASILFVYLAARRLFGSESIAALAALLLAVYVEAIVYTAYVAKENLMIGLLTAQLVLVAIPGSKPWRPLLFGAATGAMALVGNAGLALLPGLFVQLRLTNGSTKRTAQYLALAAVTCGLVIAPILWRNHEVFGAYTLNNNGGFNLYIGNNPNATPYFESITDTPMGEQWQDLREKLGERGTNLLLGDLAKQYILEHPAATLDLALRKAVVFWWPPVHSGKYEEDRVEQLVRVAWLVQFCLICGLFVAALARLPAFAAPLGVLWLLVAGYTAVHMIFYVIYRYRLPIMPILCIGAGLAAQMLLSWLVRRRGRVAVLAGAEGT